MGIDYFSETTGIVHTALAIDVEGGEGRALECAAWTLYRHQPLIWVSLHPDVPLAKYGTSKEAILERFARLGYTFQYLGVDHEEHWFLYPFGRKVVHVPQAWGSRARRDLTFEEAHPGWEDPWKVEKAMWGID